MRVIKVIRVVRVIGWGEKIRLNKIWGGKSEWCY